MSNRKAGVNQAWRLDAAKRRAAVAVYRTQGLTYDAIVEELQSDGFINKNTGKPYTKTTVQEDCLKLERHWHENAKGTIDKHKQRQLQELGEVRFNAWKKNDLKIIIDAIKLESEILGTLAAKKHQIDKCIDDLIAAHQRDC